MSADLILNALPHPVLAVGADDMITGANSAAEDFFQMSAPVLRRHRLADLLPPDSPLTALAEQARARQAQVNEYRVDLSSPRLGGDRMVDVYVSPSEEPGTAVVMLIPRAISDAMGRQFSSRGAARSVTALSAMLAHEIKNPLSGIRGAAQLLEAAVSDEDRALTQLICDETDRIVTLVDRMDAFTDERPVEREPLNVHTVLGHVRRLAESGFARGLRIVEDYDPSLPPALANRDRLIQILLNLLKNAAEAGGGEIHLSTAFRPGMRVGEPRIHLPLEICVRDNGPGIAEELRPHVFDPFVTTKINGSGLGLALVAKMVGDDGGVVEYARQGGWTVFRLLLPISEAT